MIHRYMIVQKSTTYGLTEYTTVSNSNSRVVPLFEHFEEAVDALNRLGHTRNTRVVEAHIGEDNTEFACTLTQAWNRYGESDSAFLVDPSLKVSLAFSKYIGR